MVQGAWMAVAGTDAAVDAVPELHQLDAREGLESR